MKATEIHKGLQPEPPELYEGLDEWKPNELFWIVKNGVKMTGMPAWGPTHSDEKIWAIVAFLEKLPHMNAAQYKAMDKQAGPAGEDEHDHDHGAAGGDHDHGDETDHPR
jgi:mono/diheme cytochrome c family protein